MLTAARLDISDDALTIILKRLRETDDLAQIQELSDELERGIFHKQFERALNGQAEPPVLPFRGRWIPGDSRAAHCGSRHVNCSGLIHFPQGPVRL